MKEYITVSGEAAAEYTEKHSRFIANAFHCETEQQATEIISSLKTKYWDAKHNVYAYILKDGTARFSDDGEPHGTAGKPVLDVIKGSGAVDLLVVVTRYFGGILLGTGGLVRAYSTSARDAVAAIERVLMCPCKEFEIVCDYSSHARVVNLIENSGGTVNNTTFTDNVTLEFILKLEDCEAFKDKLCEAFSSKLEAICKKELLFPIKL